ncbi:PIG-L family deacetylase [Salinibacterium sp. SWN1162]|nr:PIG-L family deacetylase [Salinibacterium sp. SWN1162]
MVKFDHRDPGTSESRWRSSVAWDAVEEFDATGIERLIVVSAHPDDETLGAAGLMKRVSSTGGSVTVILATDGDNSHPSSPTHSAAQLRARRIREVQEAVEYLAPGSSIVRLGLRDGALKEDPDAVRSGIEKVLASAEGEATIAATWRGDGHGDHRIVGEVSAEVALAHRAKLVEYPIWLWHWSSPEDRDMPWARLRAFSLDDEELVAKRQAIAAHASQVAPLSDAVGDEVVLRPEFVEHFERRVEAFIVTAVEESETLNQGFFDNFYGDKKDPWGFETRWYEERKRAITMASLPRERFGQALEVGCSIGMLSAQLAPRCDSLLATDLSAKPLEIARERLADHPQVSFHHAATAEEWPDGTFDLIVLSEVGYYFDVAALDRVLSRAAASLTPDGVLVACHWRHPVAEYPLSGDQVHQRLSELEQLERIAQHCEEDFILEIFGRRPARSVAQQTGLV